jgi:Zn-dependent protease with chaperone function
MMLPALFDHLWQSTLLAVLFGLSVLALHKAPAATRHGLWFAASLKFLIPFAALAALGRMLAPSLRLPVAARERTLIATAAQPFTQASLSHVPFAHDAALQAPVSPLPTMPSLPEPPVHTGLVLDWPLILLGVWALGFGAVLVRWAIRLGGVLMALRAARPLDWPAPMPVLASPTLLEPGLVGFLRPVLVVPESLPERLTRSQIDAILAHEACHLRRRDNLMAALHMLVEAVFWFHPLIWWIGTRLIAERERACDEAVIEAGHDRAVYARGLVESCRLYLQSPLDCVAGAAGSNLKIRVEAIMTAPPTSPLSRATKALLLTAGACAFATPVMAGLLITPEGQKVAARAAAAASNTLGMPAETSAPESQPAKPVVVERNEGLLGPVLAMARLDKPLAPLSRDVSAPLVPPPAAAPQPIQAAPPAPPQAPSRAAPAALSTDPAEVKQQVTDFVQSFAASTPSQVIARWGNPICVRVEGLAAEQAAAVAARIDEVARTVGVRIQPPECSRANIEIQFANDPQGALDEAVKRQGRVIGDPTSITKTETIVTRPIQAWYVTNGGQYAASAPDGLKALVVWQICGGPCATAMPTGDPTDSGTNASRRLLNVFVIVDLRRTGSQTLRPIADYASMLVLSESRILDRCQALPSVIDLFAGPCPGRAGPEGLTSADIAYLTALNTTAPSLNKVARRMAEVLAAPDRDLSYWVSRGRGFNNLSAADH